MDGTKFSIPFDDLYMRRGAVSAPIVVDVRRPADFAKADRLVVPAFHRPADDVREAARTSIAMLRNEEAVLQ